MTEPLAPSIDPRNTDIATFENPLNLDQHLTVLDLFGPRFQGGVIELSYRLQTSRMKQFYRRDFIHVSRMMYAVDLYRRIFGVDVAKLDAAEVGIARKLDAVRQLLERGAKEAQAAIRANGHESTTIAYGRPITYRAPIISPYAREFMEILVQADDVYAKQDSCHLLGLMDSKDKFRSEANFRKAIRSISGFVRATRIDLLKHIRNIRSQSTDTETEELIQAAMQNEATQLVDEGKTDAEILQSPSQESDVARIAGEFPAGDKPAVDTTKAPALAETPEA